VSRYPWEQVRYAEEALQEQAEEDAAKEEAVLYADKACEAGDRCPACGELIAFCTGHGEIGDPTGFAIIEKHDNDDHTDCYGDL
jgi:hypothetical protein